MTNTPSGRGRARRTPRLLTIAVVAILALGGASAAVAAPTPKDPDPTPAPTASTPPPAGSVDDVSASLDSYGPSVIVDGQSVAASLTLTNASGLPVPEASASLFITKQPFDSRTDLAAFFDKPNSAPMRLLASAPAGQPDVDKDGEPLETGTLSGRSSEQVRIAASAKDLSLPAGTAGVYGITVAFEVGTSRVFVDSMALTWQDRDIASLPVTAIATVAGPPSRATAILAGADINGVALLVDPTALTAAASPNALDGREVYMLPATNPDVASLAHAGDTALIEFALAESRSRKWTAIADQPWLALSAVSDQSVVGWADKSGAVATLFEDHRAATSPDTVGENGHPPAVTRVALADSKKAPLITPDATLSDLVATFRPSDPTGPSRIVAESALIAIEGDGTRSVVVSPGLDWIVADGTSSANLAALMAAPWVTPRTLAQTIADAQPGESETPAADGVAQDLPVDQVNALSGQLFELTRLAQTAEDPNSVLVPGGLSLLSAVSSTARGNHDLQEAAYRAAAATVDAALNGVDIVRNSDVNLIATSGEVPITVRNGLAVDSTVTVVMRSTSPNLQVRDRPSVAVPAGGEATAMIPVEAVSSANVNLSVWLINSDGDPVSEPQAFTMRVRADWGSAATAAFTGLLVLVLIGGIIRTIRRGRKDTRTGPGAGAEGAKIVDSEGHV